jgi:putative DNA primase/helicase
MSLNDVLSRLRGVRRSGSGWQAYCPAHNDRTPSLSVREGENGKVLLHCFGGAGCSYRQIIEALGGTPRTPISSLRVSTPIRQSDDTGRIELVQHLWREAKPLAGTPAQHYLENRAIRLPTWPPTLRYHASCPHPSGSRLAALVAAVTVYREEKLHLVAVHRIYITSDGRKAAVEPRKASLGSVKGGAIWLSRPTSQLLITEGIEDAMALMTMYQSDLRFAGWSYGAAVSAGNLPHLELPPEVRTVIVAADNDEAGRRAANEAACRFVREGRDGRVAYPPSGFKDFNDALLAERRKKVISMSRLPADTGKFATFATFATDEPKNLAKSRSYEPSAADAFATADATFATDGR